ncbi:hypothetical protein D3C74_401730 [compost metagenome]
MLEAVLLAWVDQIDLSNKQLPLDILKVIAALPATPDIVEMESPVGAQVAFFLGSRCIQTLIP